MANRIIRAAIVCSLAALTACGSSGYRRVVQAVPPTATIYINGEKVGTGNQSIQTFSFAKNKRVFVQAVHPDYEPYLKVIEEPQMQAEADARIPLNISMRGLR